MGCVGPDLSGDSPTGVTDLPQRFVECVEFLPPSHYLGTYSRIRIRRSFRFNGMH